MSLGRPGSTTGDKYWLVLFEIEILSEWTCSAESLPQTLA